MLLSRYTFTLCAGLLAATGCSHAKGTETTTAASEASKERPALEETNRVAATDPVMEPRMATDQDGRNASGNSNGNTQPNTSGATATAGACEPAVYFDTDSARLDATSRERLDTVAECMKRRQVDHATIVGQTDPSGSEKHNQELGLERAKAVAEYLRGRGVPDDQIRVRSKGEMASAQQPVQLWPVERRAGVDVK